MTVFCRKGPCAQYEYHTPPIMPQVCAGHQPGGLLKPKFVHVPKPCVGFHKPVHHLHEIWCALAHLDGQTHSWSLCPLMCPMCPYFLVLNCSDFRTCSAPSCCSVCVFLCLCPLFSVLPVPLCTGRLSTRLGQHALEPGSVLAPAHPEKHALTWTFHG